MSVADLTAYREQRKNESEPSLSGEARCLRCNHEWPCDTPPGVVAEIECPECGREAGVLNATVAPDSDTPLWICHCGSDVYRVLVDGVLCIACGVKTPYPDIAEADWS